MANGYWITFYRSISSPTALAEYAKAAGPAIQAGGGRFLVRGNPATIKEDGEGIRVVISEFDSLKQAIATYESPAYQAALKLLGDTAERDIRFMEGV